MEINVDAFHPDRQVLAKDFWSNLTEAVQDLRDVLEVNDDEYGRHDMFEQQAVVQDHWSYPVSSTSSMPGNLTSGGPSSLLLLRSHSPLDQTALTRNILGSDLLSVYQHRFDAVFKVLHWPTAQALIERARLNAPHSNSDGRILEAAVFFAAASTLKPHEVKDKEYLLRTTRDGVESCLAGANFVTTTSLVVLQAFVIYLVRQAPAFSRRDFSLQAATPADSHLGSLASVPIERCPVEPPSRSIPSRIRPRYSGVYQ